MNTRVHFFIIILLIFLTFILRFWQLGKNPASLDWDEASLGYNAYSILKTGRDEYGTFLPLTIRSFGDYKPALYTYLTVIPVSLFGLNEFSTRFVSAFFGVLTVFVGFLLSRKLLSDKPPFVSLLLFFFFSFSPWHIQFSRVAFEANLALFFFILGILLFLKGCEKGKYFIGSFFAFALSLYSYHSPRLVVPILILGLSLLFIARIRKWKGWFIAGVIIFLLLISPIYIQMTSSSGARLGSVTIINESERLGESIKAIEYDQSRGDFLGKILHNRRLIFTREIIAGYLDHFNFDFLFLTGDPPGRHHAVGMGMLYIWELPFILIGMYQLLTNFSKNNAAIFLWFILAPTASALTTGTPHAVRALLYLPTYQIFAGVGLYSTLYWIRKHVFQKWKQSVGLIFLAGLFACNVFYYLHMYWKHTPIEYAPSWQYGYKEAVSQVNKIEDQYKHIIVTYRYDQPYIFFLFYNQIDPNWYQKQWINSPIKRSERTFGKYEFRNIDWSKDSNRVDTIFVGTPDEIPDGIAGLVKDIHFPDGTVAFRIVAK